MEKINLVELLKDCPKGMEKLIEPQFKVGDRIKKNKDCISGVITNINDGFYRVRYLDGNVAYINSKFQDDYELVPNKFDITTLVPFESRVLVRNKNTDKWKSNFWGFYDIDSKMNRPYECCGNSFVQCIPYNDYTKHLLGTTNDCNDYYKNWG